MVTCAALVRIGINNKCTMKDGMDVLKPVSRNKALDKPSAGARIPHLVCAISPNERRLFLEPVARLLDSLPVTITWLSVSGAGESSAALRALNPTIVMPAWSTQPLLATWLESPDCALRYVCHLAGAVRWLVPRSFLERDGHVTNWGDIPSTAVAEHALLLALAALRNQGAWPAVIHDRPKAISHIEWLHTRTLFGRKVGIHGFGRVARALVPLLRPFGVNLRAYSAGVPESVFREAGVATAASLEALFAESQVLFECEALTPKTSRSVTGHLLASLPDGAIFVNVARGGLVDESALLREAVSGRLGVAVDVVTTEPAGPSCELAKVPAVVFSPHIGGPTFDQYPSCGEFALRNIARFARGEPLLASVSLEEYDRST